MISSLLGILPLLPLVIALQIPFLDRPSPPSPPPSPPLQFTLQQSIHIPLHNASLPPLHRHYSHAELAAFDSANSLPLPLLTQPTSTWIPSSHVAYQAARRHSYYSKRARLLGVLPTWNEVQDEQLAGTLEWEEHQIRMPNITDVNTIANLAKMASNAYVEQGAGSWWDLEGHFNVSDSFGWLEDGIRGHVFADPTNSTIVVAIKGTSATFIGGGGSTGKNDKTNDNLLFSCCCARVDWSWSTVCDCYTGAYTCSQECIEHAVMTKSAYYPAATNLFNNITALYPHSQIWLTGHSLGGSLASMLSRTYGVPSISYEAPGDLLPSRRLHLPLPPPPTSFRGGKSTGPEITTHVFHNADPIAMGVCNGALSSCAVAGFALETRCHSGQSVVYDTVGRLGWSVDIRTHSIKPVIEQVLVEEWGVTPEQRRREEEGEKREDEERRRKVRGWGWWPLPGGGKGDEDEEGKKPKKEPDDGQHWGRGVPAPIRQDDPEQECVECSRWEWE